MRPPHNETAPDCHPGRLKRYSEGTEKTFPIPPKPPVTQARLNAEREWLRIQRKQFEVTRLQRRRARQ